MNNKKGFTLVELLVAIVVLMIISGLSITAYFKYINQAKQVKDKENVSLVENAAKSYLKSNSILLPREIGESKKVLVSELKDQNYITDAIVNSKGKECLDDSYVIVTKKSNSDYSYDVHIYYDESEKEDASYTSTTEADIKLSFSDDKNNVSSPTFDMNITSGDDSRYVVSYSYIISTKGTTGDYVEKYSSGTIPGNNNKGIKLEKVALDNYINMTGVTYVKITVRVITSNDAGEYNETVKEFSTDKSSTDDNGNSGNNGNNGNDDNNQKYYQDNTKPQCRTGEEIVEPAITEQQWINKEYYNENKKGRTITVNCDDGSGSGCVRKKYTKSWPSDTKTVLKDKIRIFDNKGNYEDCEYDVNVDIETPKVKISAYKKGQDVIVLGEQTIDDTVLDNNKGKYTIEDDKYRYKVGDKNWLNNTNYPEGITFTIKMEDQLLSGYKWETNSPELPSGSSQSKITKNLNGPEGASATFSTVGGQQEVNIDLINEGMRYGKLTVYDAAGNKNIIEVYANIDRTAPNKPGNTKMYKWNNNSDEPKTKDGLTTKYRSNTWSNLKVFTYVTKTSDSISQFGYNIVQTGGEEGNHTSTASYRNIIAEGASTVKYNACDKAGNCSEYNDVSTILTDYTAPNCTNVVTCTNGGNCKRWLKKGETLTVSTRCTDKQPSSTKTIEISDCNNAVNTDSKTYNDDYKTDNAGAKDINQPGTVYDNAGNSTKCESNVHIQMDHTAPECVLNESVKGNKNEGWLGKNESITISSTCSKRLESGTGASSGCDNTTSDRMTYSEDIEKYHLGSAGEGTLINGKYVNHGTTVSDKAGNVSNDCPADKTVKIDTQPPTCTSQGNSTWRSSNVTVTWGCEDKPKAGVTSKCKKSSIGDKTFNTTTKTYTPNKYTIYDKADNKKDCTPTIDVYLDKTPPTFTVTGKYYPTKKDRDNNASTGKNDPFNTWVKGFERVTAQNGSDNESGFGTYKLKNGSSWTDTSIKKVDDDGSTNVTFKACDNVGNCSKEITKTVRLDNTGPTITWQSSNGAYTMKAKITDAQAGMSSGQYKWEGGSYSKIPSNHIVSKNFYSKTDSTKKIYAKDSLGNESSSSRKVYKLCTQKKHNKTPDTKTFRWQKRDPNKDTCYGDHKRYYILREVDCTCYRDNYVNSYCDATGKNIAPTTHKDSIASIQYTSQGRCYSAGQPSSYTGHHLENTFVKQVCNDGTNFQNSSEKTLYLSFHAYYFYRGKSEKINGKKYTSFNTSSGPIWTWGGNIKKASSVADAAHDTEACKWACDKKY